MDYVFCNMEQNVDESLQLNSIRIVFPEYVFPGWDKELHMCVS